MLLMHLGTQREVAVPPNVTFEEKSLLADSIFSPQFCFLRPTFFSLSLWVREKHVEYIYFIELRRGSL